MTNQEKKPVLTHPLDVELGFRVFNTGLADPLSAIQVEYADGKRRPGSKEELTMHTVLRRLYSIPPVVEEVRSGMQEKPLLILRRTPKEST